MFFPMSIFSTSLGPLHSHCFAPPESKPESFDYLRNSVMLIGVIFAGSNPANGC